ncbi:SsrA-binding protein [Chlamydia trachomatis]|uniref:SsrA-binding protein n=2 Tax=Chlamydia trachomatis TaxID=813 RepID=A0A6H2W3B7_CHLTB|nr:SsrA-binding protein [Chlamydia trachomatis]AEJ77319.1 ssrA-binding protein [Chlamydia trachomatis L2c]AGJ64431.1 single-stranded DNA-binding protein [Chlamydia trachomatis L2/434/Bu(i)]AGJ65371.1 single-stranded DNA-binding protein [Chlamydia trachomatis L2/434/Bu(f)]AGR93492.1 SsrA-binding protein [Chlamydia trachomatis RC-F/69]AGR94416.1 SsrA-binding protein [Chlamydia trachomatis RC-L2(s)/46]
MGVKEIVSNRKAFHHYEVLETLDAGIVLTGTEIKSLRDHGGNLGDAYVTISKGEAWLLQSSIAPYRFGNINNHEERRKRKLLLHKYEIHKLDARISQKGLTVVPLSFFFSKGFVKVRIGCCRGKKAHDKRQSIIEREKNRELAAAMKRSCR